MAHNFGKKEKRRRISTNQTFDAQHGGPQEKIRRLVKNHVGCRNGLVADAFLDFLFHSNAAPKVDDVELEDRVVHLLKPKVRQSENMIQIINSLQS